MASIAQNREKLQEGLANGTIRPIETISPASPGPRLDSYPVQLNAYSRTSLPPNYITSGDALRNFYHPNMPQTRIPGSFPTSLQIGAGSVAQSVLTAKGGSSAVGASFSNSAVGGDEVGGTIFGGGKNGGPYGKVTSDSFVNGYTFGKVSQHALTNNFVDPTKVGVISLGSRPQSITTSTAFTTTTTSVTVYWDGTHSSETFQIFRDDNTLSPIFSGNQAITGLGASCTTPLVCFVYQWYDEDTGQITFATNSSAIGTPAFVFTSVNMLAAQQQILRHRVPMSLLLASPGFSTPGGGTGGGSGGSGGGGGGGRNLPD